MGAKVIINLPTERRTCLVPLMVFFLSRCIVFAALYLGDTTLPMREDILNGHSRFESRRLDDSVRWDGAYYADVAAHGYWFDAEQRSSVAFYPLYPCLVALVMWGVRDPVIAALVVSNLCALGAFLMFHSLTLGRLGRDDAKRATLYLALFPTSIILSGMYAESLFLLLAISAMAAAQARKWGLASACAMLAGATRPAGVAVWAAVLVAWCGSHGCALSSLHRPDSWRKLTRAIREDAPSALSLCAMPLGLLSYMAYLGAYFGSPEAFAVTQANWGRALVNPLVSIRLACEYLLTVRWDTSVIDLAVAWNLVAALAALALSVVVWREMGEAMGIFCVLCVLLPLSWGLTSMIRFISAIFPLFMLLGRWGRNPALHHLLVAVFSTFLGVFSALFVRWYYVF